MNGLYVEIELHYAKSTTTLTEKTKHERMNRVVFSTLLIKTDSQKAKTEIYLQANARNNLLILKPP